MVESVANVGGFLKITLPELKSTRDAHGRFTSAQRLQRTRNRHAAEIVQASVVRLISERMEPTRRPASTGRLLEATANPANAQYDTWSLGVGIPSYLNRSPVVKYWRTFEEGSAAVWKHPFTGTQLYPKGPGKAPFPVAHGAIPGIRTTRKILPWMDGERYVVKHEIAPRNAYRDGAADVNLRGMMLDSARQFIRDILDG